MADCSNCNTLDTLTDSILLHVQYDGRQKLHPGLVSTSSLQKFICTTMRPTCLPYKELYNFDSCAKFVADYLAYEPLSVPNELVSAKGE